jgi:hypothetical protein
VGKKLRTFPKTFRGLVIPNIETVAILPTGGNPIAKLTRKTSQDPGFRIFLLCCQLDLNTSVRLCSGKKIRREGTHGSYPLKSFVGDLKVDAGSSKPSMVTREAKENSLYLVPGKGKKNSNKIKNLEVVS